MLFYIVADREQGVNLKGEIGEMFSRKELIYGALAAARPVVIVGGVLIFQAIAYQSITSSSSPPDDADVQAAVLMVMAALGQLLVSATIACLVGLILAIKTLRLQKRWFRIGCWDW